jgi:hypothetical protein
VDSRTAQYPRRARSPKRDKSGSALLGTWLALALSSFSCGGTARFPLHEPLQRDNDSQPFGPIPDEYVSPFAWDAANQTIFRPISRFFAVDPAGRARNVNAFDEVPDSSWFTNRLGRVSMNPEAVERGSCDGRRLDTNMPDGSWIIDKGKDNGANPGFRVNIPGVGKFMLKSDPSDEPERATGATAIASRIYYAIGYFAPCDTVVYFRPSILKLKPGLTVTNNQGVTTPFDDRALGRILDRASHRQGLVRMVASQWLPGKPIGPYTYEGTRSDDPNDVVSHEDRRELRGARLVAAWLNHFDSREQNTMDVFLPVDAAKGEQKGYVRHYIIDLGDCFGSVWSVDAFSRQFGHAYMFDVPYIADDFVTLGTTIRPWERAQRTGGVFNYFSARDFEPEMWRGEYPNPAFVRMTEADAAWMARILSRFDDNLVAAATKVGAYDSPNSQYLTETLVLRRDAILRRYLTRLSPIGNLTVTHERLCGIDLARHAHVIAREGNSFRAHYYVGRALDKQGELSVNGNGDGRFCVTLPHESDDGGALGADPSRYRIVDIFNGNARGPLRAHLYDLGPRLGFRLVGIERPDETYPPR